MSRAKCCECDSLSKIQFYTVIFDVLEYIFYHISSSEQFKLKSTLSHFAEYTISIPCFTHPGISIVVILCLFIIFDFDVYV